MVTTQGALPLTSRTWGSSRFPDTKGKDHPNPPRLRSEVPTCYMTLVGWPDLPRAAPAFRPAIGIGSNCIP